jgi:NodT family efflux transporter outer membrane factor (OMF) lipoprotein
MKVYTFLAAFVLAISGCSTMPEYKKPVAPVPAAYKDTELWKPAQPSDQTERGKWWTNFNDTLLDGLMTSLDGANADLSAAVAHFDQATAFVQKARSGLFPTITAGANQSNNQQSDNRPLRSASQPSQYNDNSLSVGLTYEIDLWGHVRSQVAAGLAAAKAAEGELESVRLSLRAELANDYLYLRWLDAQSKLLEDSENYYTKSLELRKARFEGGVDSEIPLLQAKKDEANAKAALQEILGKREVYEHAIATLIGKPAGDFSIKPDPTAFKKVNLPAIPVGIPATLLQRRPDIASAERKVEESNAVIGIAKSAYYPTITLSASYGMQSTDSGNWLNSPNIFWMIGPQLLTTIFDAGRREAVVKQAEAGFVAAGAKYRSTVLHAFQEVQDNLSLLDRFAKEAVELDEAAKNSRRSLQMANNRYEGGVANYLEVTQAEMSAINAELQEGQLLAKRLQATVTLVRALGGGWKAPG